MDAVINGLVALGTIAVAIVAIWGDAVRACLAPPKLEIRPHTLEGSPTVAIMPGVIQPSGGQPVMYYHLKVVNVRPWIAVKECRVLLRAIKRRGPDGQFHETPMAVPAQFVWANEGDTSHRITVTKESVLDFGRIAQGDPWFTPVLYVYALNFQGVVETGEAVRYFLEIDAENFTSKKPQIFEVSWDGEWHGAPSVMKRHLVIKEIKG